MTEVNEGCVGPSSEEAGKASACAGCPSQKDCASGKYRGPDPDALEVSSRLSQIKHKILVLSGKGGVGKSSTACQTAWTLASKGFSVGVLDIDICGPSVPRMMGVEDQEVHRSGAGWSPVYAEAPSEEEESIAVMSVGFMLTSKSDAIIWRGPRKNGLIKQFLTEVDWGHLDVLLIDAPPGTSDEHISIANLLKEAHPDGAVIVTTPQEVALLDVRKEITFCRKVGLNVLGVVENMAGFACPCCDTISDIFGSGEKKVQMMCEEMKTSLLGSLPLDPNILKCCEQGIGYVSKFKDAPGSRAFSAMVESLMTSTEPLKKTWDEVNSV